MFFKSPFTTGENFCILLNILTNCMCNTEIYLLSKLSGSILDLFFQTIVDSSSNKYSARKLFHYSLNLL